MRMGKRSRWSEMGSTAAPWSLGGLRASRELLQAAAHVAVVGFALPGCSIARPVLCVWLQLQLRCWTRAGWSLQTSGTNCLSVAQSCVPGASCPPVPVCPPTATAPTSARSHLCRGEHVRECCRGERSRRALQPALQSSCRVTLAREHRALVEILQLGLCRGKGWPGSSRVSGEGCELCAVLRRQSSQACHSFWPGIAVSAVSKALFYKQMKKSSREGAGGKAFCSARPQVPCSWLDFG